MDSYGSGEGPLKCPREDVDDDDNDDDDDDDDDGGGGRGVVLVVLTQSNASYFKPY